MSRWRRWRELRRHNQRDINCVHWRQTISSRTAECAPCRESGGYVAQCHAEQDARRAASGLPSLLASASGRA